MSADNWAVCPKCRKTAKEAEEKSIGDAEAAYGKVPLEEWKVMVRRAEEKAAEKIAETLREDYEIGTLADGEFYVSYRGECHTCGFKHTFKHAEQLT